MAVLSKGQTFADGDDVTHTKLNNLVDAATFVSGSSGTTDDSSLEVNGSGRLQIKDSGVVTGKIGANAVTTSKIADSTASTDGVTFAKMQYLSDMTVIGNVSGGATIPAEVTVYDEDNMATNSAVGLATQQSIKAYVDNEAVAYVGTYSGATVFTGSMPTSYTDLDLSGTVGTNRALVNLSVEPDAAAAFSFRTNGETKDVGTDGIGAPTGTTGGNAATADDIVYLAVVTDASGVVEWDSNAAGSGGTVVKVLSYQVLA